MCWGSKQIIGGAAKWTCACRPPQLPALPVHKLRLCREIHARLQHTWRTASSWQGLAERRYSSATEATDDPWGARELLEPSREGEGKGKGTRSGAGATMHLLQGVMVNGSVQVHKKRLQKFSGTRWSQHDSRIGLFSTAKPVRLGMPGNVISYIKLPV